MNESFGRSPRDPAATRSAVGTPARGLDLPDWSGQRRQVSRASVSDMLRYCEAMLPVAKSMPGRADRRRRLRVHAEFRL